MSFLKLISQAFPRPLPQFPLVFIPLFRSLYFSPSLHHLNAWDRLLDTLSFPWSSIFFDILTSYALSCIDSESSAQTPSRFDFSRIPSFILISNITHLNAAKIVNCVYNFLLRYCGTFINKSILSSVKLCCRVWQAVTAKSLSTCKYPDNSLSREFTSEKLTTR